MLPQISFRSVWIDVKAQDFGIGLARLLLFLMMAFPLVIDQGSIYPFLIAKVAYTRICLDLALCVILLSFPHTRLVVGAIFMAMAFHALTVLIVDILGADFARSFWSKPARMDGFLTSLHSLICFIVARAVLTNLFHWKLLLSWSSAVAFIVFASTVLDGDLPPGSVFGNRGFLGIYFVIHCLACAWLAYQTKPKIFKLLAFTGVTVFATGVMLSVNRSSVAALAAGGLCFALLSGRIRAALRQSSSIGFGYIRLGLYVTLGLFLVMIVAIACVYVFAGRSVVSDQRWSLVKVALHVISERPFLGWGQENAFLGLDRYGGEGTGLSERFDRAHNVFLDDALDGGIANLFVNLVVWVVLLRAIASNGTLALAIRPMIWAIAIAYFVYGTFWFQSLTTEIFVAGLMPALVSLSMDSTRPLFTLSFPRAIRVAFAATAIWLVYPSVALWVSGHAIKQVWSKCLNGQDTGWAVSDVVGAKAPYLDEQVHMLLSSCAIASPKGPFKDIALQKAFTTLSEDIYAQGYVNVRTLQLISEVALQMKRFDTALTLANTAHQMAPQWQSILLDVGRSQLGLGKFDDAIQTFTAAYNLKKENHDAAMFLAIAALNANKWELAEHVLKEHFGTVLVPDPRLATTLESIGRTVEADEIRRKIAGQKTKSN